MKVIVFGGAGFIGSHVADRLTEEGHEVSIFDIRESPYLQDNQKMIIGDILDGKLVELAVSGHDIVYHFAGIADIGEAHDKPAETIRINILGTNNILNACKNNDIQRFIFASTAYVYSKSGSFYRYSKQACELLINTYNQIHNLSFTILRYGSLYGPRATETNWINQILTQALTAGKITRLGDGEEIREYVHVKDAAKLSVDILASNFNNKCVMITGGQPMKIKDVMRMIKEILNNKIDLEFSPATGDSAHYNITPYSFTPQLAKKLVCNYHVDMGQGILECLNEIHAELEKSKGLDNES